MILLPAVNRFKGVNVARPHFNCPSIVKKLISLFATWFACVACVIKNERFYVDQRPLSRSDCMEKSAWLRRLTPSFLNPPHWFFFFFLFPTASLLASPLQVCRECFYSAFEDEVHRVIVSSAMFRRGERIAVGASGGKDSTVLAHVLTTLNARHE